MRWYSVRYSERAVWLRWFRLTGRKVGVQARIVTYEWGEYLKRAKQVSTRRR